MAAGQPSPKAFTLALRDGATKMGDPETKNSMGKPDRAVISGWAVEWRNASRLSGGTAEG